MAEAILGAVIGAIVTVLLNKFPSVILGMKNARQNDVFKKGDKFIGNWSLLEYDINYEDQLTVTSVRFGKIKCTGKLIYEKKEKQYYLEGKVNHYCITFTYYGLENKKKDNTAGVVLLDKSTPERDVLDGKWIQLRKDGEIIYGKVQLTRKL